VHDDTIKMDQVRRRLRWELATVTPPTDLLETVMAQCARRRRTWRLATSVGVVAAVVAVALPLAGVGSTTTGQLNRKQSIVLAGVRVNLPHDLRATSSTCNMNSAETIWPGNGGSLGRAIQAPLPPLEVSGARESLGGQEMTTHTGSHVCVATWLFGPYRLPPGMSLSSPWVSEMPGQPSTRRSGLPPTPFDGSEARFGGTIFEGYKGVHLHILVEDVIARIPEQNGKVDLLMAQATGISQPDFKSIIAQVISGTECLHGGCSTPS
jgi:hypothetical protein